MKLPKIIFTDIDGVWTDGSMYYDQLGNELKRFNTTDSAGVLFANIHKIMVIILTGEKTNIVERRAKKLKVTECHQGVNNKLLLAQNISRKHNCTLADCAFIGDDLNDIDLLQNIGLSACPSNSPKYIQNIVDWVIPVKGGDGAFRVFVEKILKENNLFESTLAENFNLTK